MSYLNNCFPPQKLCVDKYLQSTIHDIFKYRHRSAVGAMQDHKWHKRRDEKTKPYAIGFR